MSADSADEAFLSQALEVATRGRGAVEPNPMVGCVIVRDGQVIASGYHQQFGGPHAEVMALRNAGSAAHGAHAYVTLEPCCHQGKTGPCTQALIDARIERVVVGCEDPNPQVAGQGLQTLRNAGMEVVSGVLEGACRRLIAPFCKLITTGHPWMIAKWAMTLDGKIASHTGSSQWISGEHSRAAVHELRGVVDAIMVGRRTVALDDPLLTARPPGVRNATRIVLDSKASIAPDCQLVRTVDEAPLLIAVGEHAPTEQCQRLVDLGAEVLSLPGQDHAARLSALLLELGKRKMTNVLVEGGGTVLGTLLDLDAIDEVHAFIAPKLIGGGASPSPVAGDGIAMMPEALQLRDLQVDQLGEDIRLRGYLH